MARNKQEKLVDSEIRYRRLFETAQDGIIILDAKTGRIFDANPFLLETIGYSLKELVGKELFEIGLFRNRDEAAIIAKELKDKGYIRYEDLPLENKNKQTIDVEFVCNKYPIDGQEVVQCNIRNITARVKTEKLLAEHNEIIGKLNKVMVGREVRMAELKRQIRALEKLNEELTKEIELMK
jgi:PAS domain S-box-containing protein